jgi:hypothetical protein
MIKHLIYNLVFLIFLCLASQSQALTIESLAQEGLLKSQSMASSEESGRNIPGYSREKADIHANDIDQMDDAEMKSKSDQKMKSATEDSPEGIARDAMDKEPLSGYEDTEIFQKAEKINDDPVAAYERMTKEGCREKENEQKQQYRKVVKKELVTDTEIYEETCEKPAGGIVCEKTLDVKCEATEECEAGGIVKGSMDTGIEWEYNYPNLRLGNPGTEYLPYCGGCCSKKMFASFDLKNIKEIKTFSLKKVFLKNYLQVKLNGHVVYNNLGAGNKLEIQQRENTHAESCATKKSHYMVDSGAIRSSCLLNMCKRGGDNVDIDLREHLKEGRNTVEMEVVWSERGHIHIEIEAKQECCTKLKDKWSKRCWNE